MIVVTLAATAALCLVLPAIAPAQTRPPSLVPRPIPDLPSPLSGRFAGVSNGALIVAGGAGFPVPLFEGGTKVWSAEVDVLESAKAGWKSGFCLERPLAYGGSASVDECLICIGGSDAERHYRESFGLEWRGGRLERTPLPDLPRACAMSGAAAIGKTVYLVGGQETPASTEAMRTLWALDLGSAEPRWRELEPCPGPARILPVVVEHGGSLYVASGAELIRGDDGKAARRYLKDAYRFTPGKGWERLADIPRPAVAAPAAAWDARRFVVFGGDDGENASRVWELKEKHPGFSRDVLAYGTAAGTWSKIGVLPAGLVTTHAVPWDGGIAIPGGEDRPGHRAPQVLWLGPLPVGAVADSMERTVFVEKGVPGLVQEEGRPWRRGEDGLECGGAGSILYAGRSIGPGDFHLSARLTILGLAKSAASFVLDGSSHFGFEGGKGKPFAEGPLFRGQAPLPTDAPLVAEGKPFLFEVIRKGEETAFLIDGKEVYKVKMRLTRPLMAGFRPWRSTMRLTEFSVAGGTAPFPPRRTQPTTFTIPVIDFSREKRRQVVIDRGTAEVYQGHPTTLLMPDGKTVFAVWTIGHGGACGPMKKSSDGGLTWSDLLPVPGNWRSVRNCPAIHRLVDPAGVARLFVFAGAGKMYQSVSLDEGRTWSPMEENGLHAIVAPITIVPVCGKRLLMLYHRGEGDHDRSPLTIWQSISADGGLTWQPERKVAERDFADPCEPAIIRSPDGKQLAALLRENARRYNSLLITSDDEGETWSEPVELPASLTGDRHMPRYAPDGRLVIPFRDMADCSPTRGDFVAWVGTYDDLAHLREGQYRLRLLASPRKFDLGYPGLEVLPDGTLVTTTYVVLEPGEQNSVVSVRFNMKEVDEKAARLPRQVDVFESGKEGYHTYRIPSLLVTTKGTLLAFCEGRRASSSDSGDIDLLLRRSFDGGHTWGPAQVVAQDGANTFGNPCPVVDRSTGVIWLLLTHNLGEDGEGAIMDGKSKGTRTVWVTKSADDGATWSAPVEITATTKAPDWTWYATGPGVGIQLRSGRMVIPCDHAVAGTKAWRSHVITSDDHGATWKLGGVLGERTNECQVIERADGSLLINMRSYHGKNCRAVATSRDGGLTWSETTLDEALAEPVCQASLIRYGDPEAGGKSRVLFANPADTTRTAMTIRLSEDDGATWPISALLYPGPAAYSCLAALPDGTIGCLYERGAKHAYERITFARCTLDWLAGGE